MSHAKICSIEPKRKSADSPSPFSLNTSRTTSAFILRNKRDLYFIQAINLYGVGDLLGDRLSLPLRRRTLTGHHGFLLRHQQILCRWKGEDQSENQAVRKRLIRTQTVIITGGSQGMGRGLAKILSQKGANIVIVARTQSKLDDALKYIAVCINDVSPLSGYDTLLTVHNQRPPRRILTSSDFCRSVRT